MQVKRINLLELVHSELCHSERLLRRGQRLHPRFLVLATERRFRIAVEMPDRGADWTHRLDLLRVFMSWKLANAFVVSMHSAALDALVAFAVSRSIAFGVARHIERDEFGRMVRTSEPIGLSCNDCAPEIVRLLPQHFESISDIELQELREVFGPEAQDGRIGLH